MKRCCIIMIVPHESATIRYAVVAELADAHGSGPCGRPWGFESLRPHQMAKHSSKGECFFVVRIK